MSSTPIALGHFSSLGEYSTTDVSALIRQAMWLGAVWGRDIVVTGADVYRCFDHMDPEVSPVEMECVYESLKDSREKKEEEEDLKFVIRHAKLSAANCTIQAHRVDTENNQSPPI